MRVLIMWPLPFTFLDRQTDLTDEKTGEVREEIAERRSCAIAIYRKNSCAITHPPDWSYYPHDRTMLKL